MVTQEKHKTNINIFFNKKRKRYLITINSF